MDPISERMMQAVKTELAFCEEEISALAREALWSKTTAVRRADALIARAKMQTRSVSLSRQLQRLRLEQEAQSQVTPQNGELTETAERVRPRKRAHDRFIMRDFSRAS